MNKDLKTTRTKHHLLLKDVLFIFILSGLIIWMLRDVFLNFSSHIVGDGGDAPIFLWNLWWVKKAIIDLKSNPMHTDYIFYPTGTSLIYHTLTITNALLSIALQQFLSLIQSFNVLFLINFLLSGIFTFLVCRKMQFDYIGSLFAGLIFALAPNIVAQTLGHANLYSVWFIPASLLLAIYFVKKPSWASSVGLAIVLTLAAYNDYYITAYTIIILAIYFVSFLLSRQNKNWRRLLVFGLVGCATLVLFVSPIFIEMKTGGKNLKLPPISIDGYNGGSGDLAGFLVPSFLNRDHSKSYFKNKLHNVVGAEGVNYLGTLPLILVLCAFVFTLLKNDNIDRYFVIFAFISLTTCLLLSLGPKVFYFNKVYTPDIFSIKINLGFLYDWISRVPIAQSLRVPIRFVTPAMLCLAILCAYSITCINRYIQMIKFRTVSISLIFTMGIILFAILIDEYKTKLWTYDARISPIYNLIAEDKDDVAVLELPFRQQTGRSWGIGEGFSKQQLAQTVHQKKILSGYISCADEAVQLPVLSAPGIHYLATNLNDLSLEDESSVLARDSFAKLKIRYIVLSIKEDPKGTWYKMEDEKIAKADSYIKQILDGKVIGQDELNVIYRISGI